MPKLFRTITFDRSKIDAEKRTVPITFSTETAVDRGMYDEILDHGAADMSRMGNAPLLLNHDFDKQIGAVDSAEIKDREGRSVVRFSKSPLGDEIFNDVKDGIRTQASVGYERMEAISRVKAEGGRDAIRFSWRPFEISITPVGADPNAGVGRSHPIENDPIPDLMKRNLLFKADPAEGGGGTGTGTGTTAATTEAQITEARNQAKISEQKRSKDINSAAAALTKVYPGEAEKFRGMAEKAISEDHTAERFNADLLAAIPGIKESRRDVMHVGFNAKEKRFYSILRAIQKKLDGEKLDGIEGEADTELRKRAKEIGISFSGGNSFVVPADIEVNRASAARGYRIANPGQRDLNVTTAGQGGDFVQTSILTPIVELLRNRMVCERLGVQTLTGLQGNIAIPRQTGAATAYSLAESALLTLSTQAINQIGLSPHRVGAVNRYTKQLLLQSSVDVENFMRDDMMKVLAIYIDNMILNGTGANSQPTGLFNQTGIGAVTFGGAATWANILAFESALALANADVGKMAYVTDTLTRGRWKAITKVANYPSFLWENAVPAIFAGEATDYGTGTRSNDGMVNGYRAAATNQIANSRVLFANWEDAILAMWGGFDVVVNPYTYDVNAEVQITVNTFIDVALRHAQSVCASTDPGNQ